MNSNNGNGKKQQGKKCIPIASSNGEAAMLGSQRSDRQSIEPARSAKPATRNGTHVKEKGKRTADRHEDRSNKQLLAALSELEKGWYSVPIPFREKGPKDNGWQELRLGKKELGIAFAGNSNRGLLLGKPSGNLIDVDLDCPEAIQLAPAFLPETDRRHGRRSAPNSHWWYVTEPRSPKTQQFRDPCRPKKKSMIVELRSTGGQTVVPPSVHPNGERYEWGKRGRPATERATVLESAVRRLAAAALLVRYWPGQGSRHDAALALAGTLLQSAWDEEAVAHYIEAVVTAAGDEEAEDRVRAVASTAEKIAAGEPVTGWSELAELLDHRIVHNVAKWLNLARPNFRIANTSATAGEIETAREVFEDWVEKAKSGPTAAIREALLDQQVLADFAHVYKANCGQVEGRLLELRDVGVKKSEIDMLRQAVKQTAMQLAASRSRSELASDQDASHYVNTSDGIIWHRRTHDGIIPERLTNFSAEIIEEVHHSDGLEIKKFFKIAIELQDKQTTVEIPVEAFASMTWPIEKLGCGAVVFPGVSTRDHARAAIQLLSPNVASKTVHCNTGWVHDGEQWQYLHAGGAIGAIGAIPNVEVLLPDRISAYHLPEPPRGKFLKTYIRMTLELRKLAPRQITCCLEGATFRAALGGDCDSTVWLTGKTGGGKSELTARYQQHFGERMGREALPGNWQSTGNALEALAFAAKDVTFTIDDFKPVGTQYEINKLQQLADRVIRPQRNKGGRQRMAADGSLRSTKWPRGVLIASGEEIPDGASLRASMMIVELGAKSTNWDLMSSCQKWGEHGCFVATMAAFVNWLAKDYEALQRKVAQRVADYRNEFLVHAKHNRTAELATHLLVGTDFFLQFAEEMKAINKVRARKLRKESKQAITDAMLAQSDHLADADPAQMFIELTLSGLRSGEAHLLSLDGAKPSQPVAYGWRKRQSISEFVPGGKQIGWVGAHGELYLDPHSSYNFAQDSSRHREQLGVSEKTLHKRLKEGGFLATWEEGRCTQRVSVVKRRVNVLHLPATLLNAADDDNSI